MRGGSKMQMEIGIAQTVMRLLLSATAAESELTENRTAPTAARRWTGGMAMRLVDSDELLAHVKDLPTWWADDGGVYGKNMKYPEGMFDCEGGDGDE